MRAALAVFLLAAAVLVVTAANAEKRIFIVASNPDGYGVDRCLAAGATCGAAAAAAYCQSKQFATAISYRRLDRDEITGAVPASGRSCGPGCDEFVAIECSR